MEELMNYKSGKDYSSLYLVEQINIFRKLDGNKSELLHKNILAKIEIEFIEEIGELKIQPSSYIDASNRNSKCYHLNFEQSLQLLMSESRIVRKGVVQKLKESRKPMSLEQIFKHTIMLADQRIKELEAKVESDKPKVNFANAITGTTSNIDFETFAKVISDQQGVTIGRNRLMKWFRDNKFMTPKNKPYQSVVDRGLMKLKEGSYINPSTDELVTYTQPRITGKGQIYFANKLIDENN